MKLLAPPTATDPGESLISGENGSTISCSVKAQSNGIDFAFSGSMHGTTPQGDLISVTFAGGTINATDAQGNPTGTVNLTVYTPELSANFVSPTAMQCTVMVIEKQIKGGSMWAEFNCAQPISYATVGPAWRQCDSYDRLRELLWLVTQNPAVSAGQAETRAAKQ